MRGDDAGVTFNGWVGNKDWQGNLAALAKATDEPLVIATQETANFRGTFPGYERVAAPPGHPRGRDAYGCVLFVRRSGARVVKPRILEVGGPDWIGPKHDLVHKPRVFVGATIEIGATGRRRDVLCAHRNPGGPHSRNPGAWRAEDEALVEWVENRLARHPDREIWLPADWNNSPRARGPLTVQDLARRLDAQMIIPWERPAIDGFLVINGPRMKGRKLQRGFGSDGHRPVLVTR